MFFISKCAISISFSVTYVYTTELFPTNLRQGLMGICAACGYIGSMTAPQTPLLVSELFLCSIYVTITTTILMIARIYNKGTVRK